jgi:3-methyl-2-oxobutanoate hydroxymethyltransferase
MTTPESQRTTIRHLRHWARDAETFPLLTCYDATMARWLARAGIRVLLVGDTAAQTMLGHDSTLPVSMDYMLEITRAVRRGAPNACIMADMPFGSYQAGHDQALHNAAAFLKHADADLVKLEVDETYTPLVERMTRAGIPVVAHIGSRPQTYRSYGTPVVAGRDERVANLLLETAQAMIDAGAVSLLVEAVPDGVTRRIVDLAVQPHTGRPVPVIGCGAGPGCHGYVIVLHDLLGLTDHQPSFARPQAAIGQQIQDAAAAWRKRVASDDYVREGGPYGA